MVSLLLISCDERTTFSGFGPPEKLVAQEIEIDLSRVAFPNFNMILFGDYLVFADSKSDYWIKVIDLRRQKVIAELGQKGRGPNEINFIYGIDKIPSSGNMFFVNDAPKKQLLLYNIDSVIIGKNRSEKKINMASGNMIRNVVPLTNGLYLSENLTSENYYLALYNQDFSILSESLRYPDEIKNALLLLNKGVWSAAFSPGICLSPKGNKVFTYLQNTDFIELFSLDSNNIESKYRSFTYLPEFVITSRFDYTYRDIRGGILNCYCTEKYIYCLANNHSENLTRQDLSQGENHIFIFSWDGAPVSRIELDRDIFLFAVDADDKTLYAFTYGEEIMKLLKYEL